MKWIWRGWRRSWSASKVTRYFILSPSSANLVVARCTHLAIFVKVDVYFAPPLLHLFPLNSHMLSPLYSSVLKLKPRLADGRKYSCPGCTIAGVCSWSRGKSSASRAWVHSGHLPLPSCHMLPLWWCSVRLYSSSWLFFSIAGFRLQSCWRCLIFAYRTTWKKATISCRYMLKYENVIPSWRKWSPYLVVFRSLACAPILHFACVKHIFFRLLAFHGLQRVPFLMCWDSIFFCSGRSGIYQLGD